MAVEAYKVEIDKAGCAHCKGGTFWTVVGPGDVGIGTSWADEETASDIADLMNMAFDAGKEADEQEVEFYRTQLNDANHHVAELQEQVKAARPEGGLTEARTREILGALIKPDGGLDWSGDGPFMRWYLGDPEATLDGDFTADQLEAIAFWMRLRMNVDRT